MSPPFRLSRKIPEALGCVLLFSSLCTPADANGGAHGVVDTGHAHCYDTTSAIACPTGRFSGQDAQYQGLAPAYRDHGDSAHAAIRGYLYQTCLGVLRWLDLKNDETLVVEGDEDLDRLLRDGTAVCEQVKAYEGRLSVRDRVPSDPAGVEAYSLGLQPRSGASPRSLPRSLPTP